ncbi:hypothetical protein H257_12719 [Aphanomyces astaci]|uniref:Crinkler effector protein N-terminal domain-containing protein n=1 Tax=Aphanomyces astaci TaxID=112090 RepID=W4FZ39_APHAT|nr:hypothetical protein H257_12719 [Aphanomyces astaci]ETV72256.1 hypothetical protein H257_12719 [Aphanomyces astaci]RQM24151.1 hypothetical protein B5M09_013532 [Aphanomyces astaci]|eukprot:XP_009838324.1 hypothetical protein H257_12719 [Aphanomyces astaci]
MLDLTCVVVGDGHIFSAQIDADETVHDVKIAFTNEFIHGCQADAVELYRVEGATHGAGTQVVFNGTPVDASTCTLATFGGSTTQMVDGSKVSSYFDEANAHDAQGVHILVVAPGAVVQPGALKVRRTTPSSSRQERWDTLNAILEDKLGMTGVGVVAFSSVKWLDVKDVFEPTPYTQPSIELPPENLDFLARYLKMASTCLGPISEGNEAQRVHLIAPILFCVCSLFDGDVRITTEKKMHGRDVKAQGRFEFVLRGGKKKNVCIVEAKSTDLWQGMAQALLGCEVQAEVCNLHEVFGIVTNYTRWWFLRSLDDKIEKETCSLVIEGNVPTSASLRTITGKIYALLSED